MTLKHILASGTAVISLTLAAAPAMAQNGDAEVDQLRAEVATLKAQLEQLSSKVDANAEKQAKASPEVKWKGAPQMSSDDGWSFKPRGRILFDAASVNAPDSIVDDGLGFSNEARRVRLGVQGTIPGSFGYKLEADFAGGGAELTDALLNYKSDGFTVTVGQHNTFQSLEELSSSNDTSFIERSAFTDAFGFERRVGASVQYKAGDVLLQGGVFTANIADLDDDTDNSVGFDGRVVFAPKIGDAQAHFGASYHYRDLGDANTTRRYRQRPLVHSTDTRFINTGTISDTESESSYGLEAAVIAGRFHAAGETHWLKLNRTAGNPDPTFFGGSIEAGVFLTDDTRGYKTGVFKGTKVSNPIGKGGFGALQFNVRYDYLDLVDAGIVGGIQNSYQASLIWTPVNYVRFMLNYGRMEYDQAAILAGASDEYGVDVFGGRFQVSF